MCIGHIANNRNALHHDTRENQNFNLHDKLQENGGGNPSHSHTPMLMTCVPQVYLEACSYLPNRKASFQNHKFQEI